MVDEMLNSQMGCFISPGKVTASCKLNGVIDIQFGVLLSDPGHVSGKLFIYQVFFL